MKRPQYITFDLDIKSSSKVSNMYFFDRTTQELPFSNKDTLQVFGFIRLDEQKKPFIENTSIKLVKTADL